MNRRLLNVVMVLAASAGIALSGCGNGSSGTPGIAGQSYQTVSGVVSDAAPISATVTIQDSSTPAKTETTRSEADGKYSFEASTLKAPFILIADFPSSRATRTVTMYSYADSTGTTNINPFSHVTVGAAAELSDEDEMSETRSRMDRIKSNYKSVVGALKVKLAPLFLQYGVTGTPFDDDESDGLNALFADVRIRIYRGDILVTNRLTGGLIFKASVDDIAGGTFYPENLPGGTPDPTSCTYTYSVWGECQPDGTQTRTVTNSSPAGCSGTPVLSQNCTYTPPTPACGSCHSIPPSSGRHSRHSFSCSTCHGSGYSNTTENAATHNNGTRDIVSSFNWDAATRTCGSPGCHGSRTW